MRVAREHKEGGESNTEEGAGGARAVAWLPTEYDRRSNERLITPAWFGLSLCLDSFIGSA